MHTRSCARESSCSTRRSGSIAFASRTHKPRRSAFAASVTPHLCCPRRRRAVAVVRRAVPDCHPRSVFEILSVGRDCSRLFFLMIRRPPRSTLFSYPSLFCFFLKNPPPTDIHTFTPHAVFRF